MNREIKFRAWDKKRNKMLFFGEQGFNNEYCLLSFQLQTDENNKIDGEHFGFGDLNLDNYKKVPIMQFTGLYDKNGKEIYEGDIVKYEDEKYIHEIKFGTACIDASDYESYCVTTTGFYLTNYLGNHNEFQGLENTKNLEIIGNVYENRDLYETKT